jgi:hypothetical protein
MKDKEFKAIIRIQKEFWAAYKEVCDKEKTNRSKDLKEYIKTRIKTK